MILSNEASQLLIVDVQERLAPAMSDPNGVIANCTRLVESARLLGVPITISEQYPKGIGPTIAAILDATQGTAPIFEKMTFSCIQDELLGPHLVQTGKTRPQIVICGIEAHVCVLQSALDLVQDGFKVFVVVDAISSRSALSLEIAMRRLEQAGISLVTTEMVIFEWLMRAGTSEFKQLMRLVK